MIDAAKNTIADFAATLLVHYSFDLGGYTAKERIDSWLKNYPATWIRSAVIEALYQGRYKAISVEQILGFWQRRGFAVYHFNHEFERLICGNLPLKLAEELDTTNPTSQDKAISHNGHETAVVKALDAGEKMTGAATDVVANMPPILNGAKELTQRRYQISANKQKSRSPSTTNHPPIEYFTPTADNRGDFYTKLKAIAQHSEDAQQSN